MTDIDQKLISAVRSTLARLSSIDEYIDSGPKRGHRFDPGPYPGDSVPCLLCGQSFVLETDSRIPCPTRTCPNRDTNEAEKADRTVEESLRILRDAEELETRAAALASAQFYEEAKAVRKAEAKKRGKLA